MPRIFVSQRRVHQWTEEGRVSVDGNTMNLPELGRTFKLTEAFFVERVVSEGGDAFKLMGRVKTRAQIAALGGEGAGLPSSCRIEAALARNGGAASAITRPNCSSRRLTRI